MPLVGRAETTSTIHVYNSGFDFPDFYLCFERDIYVYDRENDNYQWWRFTIAYAHITSQGGWYGSRDFSLVVFNESDLRQNYEDEFYSEDFSFSFQAGYAITRRLNLAPLCDAVPLRDGFNDVELGFDIHLSSGYLSGTYYKVNSSSFSLVQTVTIALKAFTPSVVFGEVAVQGDDVQDIYGGLSVPTAPPLPSEGYINLEAIRHCAGALAVFPTSILVALMSTVSLSFGLSLFLILKHS